MPDDVVTLYVHFTGEDTEAQEGEGTCPDTEPEAEPGLEDLIPHGSGSSAVMETNND